MSAEWILLSARVLASSLIRGELDTPRLSKTLQIYFIQYNTIAGDSKGGASVKLCLVTEMRVAE